MSKRFGRNQKRRLLEKNKELQFTVNALGESRNFFKSHSERYKHQYEELTSAILEWWDYSVLLDPKTMQVQALPHEWRLVQYNRQITTPFSEGGVPSNESLTFHHELLSAVEVAMREDLGSRKCHILLRVSDKEIGYYIDTAAFDFLANPPQVMAEYISRMIACFKEKFMRKDGRDGQ